MVCEPRRSIAPATTHAMINRIAVAVTAVLLAVVAAYTIISSPAIIECFREQPVLPYCR